MLVAVEVDVDRVGGRAALYPDVRAVARGPVELAGDGTEFPGRSEHRDERARTLKTRAERRRDRSSPVVGQQRDDIDGARDDRQEHYPRARRDRRLRGGIARV